MTALPFILLQIGCTSAKDRTFLGGQSQVRCCCGILAGRCLLDHLREAQVFCSDLSLYDTFNTVYRSYFTGDYPGRAFIGNGPLFHGARSEVLGVAVKTPE